MFPWRRWVLAAGLLGGLAGCGHLDPLAAEGTRACLSAQALADVANGYARGWAADAYLVQAEGFRLDGTTRLSRQPGSRWEFRFASVRRGQLLSVTVPAKGEIVRQPGPLTTDPFVPVRPGANWRVDSDRAMSLARSYQKDLPTAGVERLTLRSFPWDGRRYRLAWVVAPETLFTSQPLVVDALNGDQLRF